MHAHSPIYPLLNGSFTFIIHLIPMSNKVSVQVPTQKVEEINANLTNITIILSKHTSQQLNERKEFAIPESQLRMLRASYNYVSAAWEKFVKQVIVTPDANDANVQEDHEEYKNVILVQLDKNHDAEEMEIDGVSDDGVSVASTTSEEQGTDDADAAVMSDEATATDGTRRSARNPVKTSRVIETEEEEEESKQVKKTQKRENAYRIPTRTICNLKQTHLIESPLLTDYNDQKALWITKLGAVQVNWSLDNGNPIDVPPWMTSKQKNVFMNMINKLVPAQYSNNVLNRFDELKETTDNVKVPEDLRQEMLVFLSKMSRNRFYTRSFYLRLFFRLSDEELVWTLIGMIEKSDDGNRGLWQLTSTQKHAIKRSIISLGYTLIFYESMWTKLFESGFDIAHFSGLEEGKTLLPEVIYNFVLQDIPAYTAKGIQWSVNKVKEICRYRMQQITERSLA